MENGVDIRTTSGNKTTLGIKTPKHGIEAPTLNLQPAGAIPRLGLGLGWSQSPGARVARGVGEGWNQRGGERRSGVRGEQA